MITRELRKLRWTFPLAVLALYLLHVYRIYGTGVALVDDTFIFLRYARHWAMGYGLVWNLGEPPVEGVSSLLYTALLALGFLLKVEALLWTTLVNLGLGLGVLGITYILAGYVLPSYALPRWQWIPPLIVATAPGMAFWTAAGMDIVLFTLVLLGAVVLTLRAWEHDKGWLWVGWAYGMLGMARLDGALFFALTWLAVILGARWVRHRSWSQVVTIAGRLVCAFGLVFGPFYVARWAYFGWPLPMTYYAKLGVGWPTWLAGWQYVADFLRQPGVVVLLVWTAVGWGIYRRWSIGYLVAVSALLIGRVIVAGGDWMPHWRLLVPLWPFLGVLGTLGMVGWMTVVRPSRGMLWRWGMIGLVFLTVGAPSWRYLAQHPYRLWRPLRLVEPMQAPQYAQGLALRERLCPGDTMALIAIGATAYLNDEYRVIDMLGLTEPHIAFSPPILWKGEWDPGHARLDIEHVVSQRPEWIQLDTRVYPTPEFTLRSWMPPQVIWRSPAVREAYVFYPLPVVVPTDYPKPRRGYIFFLHRRDAAICGPTETVE